MFEIERGEFSGKADLYDHLERQARVLLTDERDPVANAANLSSLIFHSLPELNWVGVYFLHDDQLLVGPFQGKPACVRIALGRGVCGTAAAERRTVVVDDVGAFPGHIPCDAESRAEIVVPLIAGDDELLGVLDVDSPRVGRFDEDDVRGLERLAACYVESLD